MEQNRTEQNRTEQNRTKGNGTESKVFRLLWSSSGLWGVSFTEHGRMTAINHNAEDRSYSPHKATLVEWPLKP